MSPPCPGSAMEKFWPSAGKHCVIVSRRRSRPTKGFTEAPKGAVLETHR